MLRSFRLGNHCSFADEQELLLMPAAPGDQRTVVPVTAIYGANASGKSNLLDGLRFMQRAVIQSFARWDADEGVTRHPFRLRTESASTPSVFVVELVVDNIPYTYGFSLNDEEILEEWLYAYPKKRPRKLFERTRDDIRFSTTIEDVKPKLELIEELTRPNALFLSAVAQTKLESLMPVYRWIRSQLRMRTTASPRLPLRVADQVGRLIARNPENLDRLVGLIQAADIGITDLHLDETDNPRNLANAHAIEARVAKLESALQSTELHDRDKILTELKELRRHRNNLVPRATEPRFALRLQHGESNTQFELDDESAGTVSWLQLLPMVLDALDSGHVMVVDEIDTSLHPLLTARLVGLFQDEATNPYGAQLVFTTHDASLLGTMLGDDVLQRDQVWFVEKNAEGASNLYPLTDFKPRKEHNTERRYLGGSYGAVPLLDPQDFARAVRSR
ncbi:MAG: AAA family ATPase [Haloechinothrix sp.]